MLNEVAESSGPEYESGRAWHVSGGRDGRASGRSPDGGFQDRLSRHWAQISPSPYPWEQEGLDFIRGLMPNLPPYRAVTLFTFTAFSGRISECDLFIAVPGGLYLVELKGHPGRLTNRGSDWTFHALGSDHRARTRRLPNPLHSVDVKSKDLKERLKRAAQDLGLRITMPRVEPAVFLSDTGLVSELDEVERKYIYGRDDRPTGLPGIWRDLLGRPPARAGGRIGEDFTRHLPRLFNAIGVSAPQAHLRYGDDWRLAGKPLDQGPTWEDRLATRQGAIEETGRVRIYLTELEANESARTTVVRAAEREYYLLQGLRHRGIDEARDIRHHDAGPAILFRHDEADLRLDQYMAAFGDQLSFETRLGLIRQLAEALRYAHRHSLYHRSLAARSVYVSARPDGSRPVLRIVDWQTAARDYAKSIATRLRSLGRDDVTDAHLRDASVLYLAPEFNSEYPDPTSMDVFGLGAVSYLILTGQPPAATQGALLERLQAERGLHPAALVDGLDPDLDRLVYSATRHDVDDRLPDVDAFFALLKEVEAGRSRTASPAQAPTAYTDPLEAGPGDWLSEDLCVRELLGTGGTGRALLVEKLTEAEDGEAHVTEHVLKVALNHTDARDRLFAEAEALGKVGGGQIVRLLGGPRELGGHPVLDIQYAGDRSLARVLREEGRLPYTRLRNLAEDLFQALLSLERNEVIHRDIKPDNLGVYKLPRNDERVLLLFDFSLVGASPSDTASGTSGYLDPFLGSAGPRPRYDEHAERYAVAVTLHQMASGEKPVWGNGTSDPKSLDDELPSIATELFSQQLREGLTRFFEKALHRDAERRFDSARQMLEAWNRVFIDAERTSPRTPADSEPRLTRSVEDLEAQRNQASEAAEPETTLDAAGLSPAAIEVAHNLGAATVGELLGVPQYRINRARGAGTLAKRELNQRYREWARKFRRPTVTGSDEQSAAAAMPTGPEGETGSSDVATVIAERLPVDELAAGLINAVEGTVRRRTGSKRVPAIRAYLGVPEPTVDEASVPSVPFWPTQTETARALGFAQAASVNQYLSAAVAAWARLDWITRVRDELEEILTAQGRVMAVRELASELRARFGARTDDRRQALRDALAITRAALLVEAGDNEPRFTESRRGSGVFVACESLPGAAVAHPAKDELIDYAVWLGQCADNAVRSEPLPGPKAVRGLLRSVREPEGQVASLSDSRLVALSAAASLNALASPRADLYPRDLSLERALRISQAAAGVGYEPGVSVADLLERVRVRFPELDFGDVMQAQLSEALDAAGYPLRFDYAKQVFRGPERSALQSTGLDSGTAIETAGAGASAGVGAVVEAAVKRLGEAVEDGGFRALTVSVRHLPGLADAIGRRFPALVPVNGNAEFLSCFRELAAEQGQDWKRVLRVDGRLRVSGGPNAQTETPRAYAEYVTEVAQRLRTRWIERAETQPRSTVLLHNAGLLARYWDITGRELVTGLQQSARRAGETPHGLWLLCPTENAKSSPTLDGRLVETVIADGEWIVLGSAAVAELKDGVNGEVGHVASATVSQETEQDPNAERSEQ